MNFKKIKIITSGAILLFTLLSFSNIVSALTISPPRFEISADPGETVTHDILITNESDTDEIYYVSYSNFEAQGETGTPTFVNATEGLGTWISTNESIRIPASKSELVTLKITVPKNADPGGYFAAVFWGTSPEDGEGVSIGAKTGALVLLTVNGDIDEQGGILEFFTKNKETFFTSLPIQFYYRFQNSGDNRIKPEGDIIIKNMISLTSAKVPGNPVDGNILPKSVRKFETTWQGKDGAQEVLDKDKGGFFDNVKREWRNFAFGHYRAELTLAYGTKNEISTATYGFWVFPWHLTLFVVILAILIFVIGRWLIRRYNKWVISQAEMMLKREQANNQGMNQ